MKTRSEIRQRAEAVATRHFMSEDNLPWEPFARYEPEWLEDQIEALADAIEASILWAIEN